MRIATPADVDTVAELLALAFADDPLWGPLLEGRDGSTAHLTAYWTVYAEGAIPQGMVFLADEDAALALWIPPGGEEMTDQQHDTARQIVLEHVDPAQHQGVFDLWDRFDAHHPQTEPHAYLSLLGTHPAYRGRGIAQALVRENLAEFDRHGVPTYLESSNPANDHRYERLGYVKIGEFAGATDDLVVSTMWRAVP